MVLYILKAGTLTPKVIEKRGDFGELYISSLRAAGYATEAKVVDVQKGEYPPELKPSDVILISGSKENAWEDNDWVLQLRDYIKAQIDKIPILGVCFGHQIIARALGARMGPSDEGWEISALAVRSTDLAKRLFPTLGENPFFMHIHGDKVYELPQNTKLLFSSDITPIQGFYRPGKILSVQFHPEFDEQVMTLLCSDILEGKEQEDALARVSTPELGPEFMKYCARFLNQELEV